MTHVTCRLTAKNRNQLRNPTLGNRVWATFLPFLLGIGFIYPFVIDVVKRLFNSVRPISCVVETEISIWCRFAETPLCIPCYYRMEPINSCNPSNLAVSQQCGRYESGSPRWRRNDMLACCGLSMVQSPGECFWNSRCIGLSAIIGIPLRQLTVSHHQPRHNPELYFC